MDSSSYHVYTGAWTNWSQGKVFGATLTTTPANGSLLIAFISLFITLVGTHFWRIGCFVFHHVYSTEASRDGLHHQRQAILRNSANGASGLWSLSQVLCAWRTTASRPFSRILPLVIFTLITLGAFAVASTFSSRLSTLTGNAVLISPGNCGIPDISRNQDLTVAAQVLNPYSSERMSSSANYVQQCYMDRSVTQGCLVFPKKSLPAHPVRNATCPFSESICKSQNTNLLLDTGYLDSNLDFGINMPRDENWLYRRIMHCAPLKTEDYRRSIPKLEGGLDIAYMQYFYGESVTASKGSPTYQYPILNKAQVYAENFTSSFPDFSLK